MPLVVKDRVRETTTTVGTGTVALAGAVTGFQSFSVIGNGNTTYYAIVDGATGDWEVGLGTYTLSGTTLSRTTVLESSNGGALVPFVAGTKDVFCTYPAERSVYVDGTSIVPATAATLPPTSGGTGLATVAQGDILYGSAANTLSALPKNTTATRYLANTGTSNNPAWAQIDLSNGVTGTLPTTNGGTGLTSYTANGVVYASSTSALATGSTLVFDGTNLIAGNASQITGSGGITPRIEAVGTSGSTGTIAGYTFSTGASGPNLELGLSKNASIGTFTTPVSSGDTIGAIRFSGSDGSSFGRVAQIVGAADATASSGSTPGRLVFSTTPSGSTTPTERLRISTDGRLQVNGSNTLTSSLVATANNFPLAVAATAYQFRAEATFDAANTSGIGFGSTYQFPSSGTFANSYQFYGAGIPALTGTAALTNNFGLYIASQTAGTNIYGVYSNIAAASNRWNFYANGTADNYFAGKVGIGTTTPTEFLEVNKNQAAGTGILVNNGLTDANAYATVSAGADGGNAILNVNSSLATTSALLGGGNGASLYTTSGLTAGLSVGTQAGALKFFAASSTVERMRIHTNGFVGIGVAAPTAELHIAAGTSTANTAPLKFTSGTNLSTPEAGVVEYDGVSFYTTANTTSGRGFTPTTQFFRLTSDGSAISTIANFFGATSGVTLVANAFYELEAVLYFTKTTAGTVTFTMTYTQAPVNNNAFYVGTPVGGVGTVGTSQTAAIVKSTATAGALPATGSLTTAVNHQYVVRSMFQANATTGGTLNLQLTASAGTATPLTGSYYKITRLPAANVGAFV